jgi:hypothetical protein
MVKSNQKTKNGETVFASIDGIAELRFLCHAQTADRMWMCVHRHPTRSSLVAALAASSLISARMRDRARSE